VGATVGGGVAGAPPQLVKIMNKIIPMVIFLIINKTFEERLLLIFVFSFID
jgi:hypothetical protein